MKYMIISDIHGDIYKLNTVLDIYNKEKCDKLIVLGDLFNYGIDLNKNDIYEFKGTEGIVHLEVKDGEFRVFDVDCPNHDCEYMGWMNKDSLFPIVCLPNEIIIYPKSK